MRSGVGETAPLATAWRRHRKPRRIAIRAIYEELYEFRHDVAEVHRRLAYDLQRFWEGNDVRLAPVRRAFRVAAYALAAEVVVLIFLASDTLQDGHGR
jgi:hypothetical protein